MANVLVIDDEKYIGKLLSNMVEEMGHSPVYASSLTRGLAEATSRPYDVVFLDVMFPDGSGLEVLPKIRETASHPEVIIMTGYGDPDGAEIAIKNGAWDYVEKPFSSKRIILVLNRVIQYRKEYELARKPPKALKIKGVTGSSPKMQTFIDSLAQAAGCEANTLIYGETGTGKEIYARAIHENSHRRSNNYIVVDCAALMESLVESALFGHVKGAFTGADKERVGLIKEADEGTLFLDEIGELPLAIQKKFLRFLQERSFRPVGSKKEVKSDFRLVAATNRNLEEMVEKGGFRRDLLYRLQTLTLTVPPLRKRITDIEELVMHYTRVYCEKNGTETKGFSPGFFDALYKYDWPGNIRELFNLLEQIFTERSREPTVFVKHIPEKIRIKALRATVKGGRNNKDDRVEASGCALPEKPQTLREFRESVLSEAEADYLNHLIAHTGGSVKEACRIAGVSRTSLYNLMKKHNISRFKGSNK